MKPKRTNDEDEQRSYLHRSLATGIFHWQEMAHMDFQELFELTRDNELFSEEPESDFEE